MGNIALARASVRECPLSSRPPYWDESLSSLRTSACWVGCLQVLRLLENGQRLAVDADDAIVNEYLGTLRACAEPGLATKLAHRLFRMRRDSATCHLVAITPVDNPPGSYAEIPPSLQDFDLDDQKFLAVALAEGDTPPVFAALDREWWNRRVDLAAVGLDVQFVCATDLI